MSFVPYFEYLASPEWKERAKAAKRRAGWRCQICFSPERLDVHHRTYQRLGRELDSDLTVLCRLCHQAAEDDLARRRERRAS